MNNLVKYTLLIIGLLVPQLFFMNYWLVLATWVLTGFILAGNFRKIFLIAFLIQLMIGVVLFFLWSANSSLFLLDIPVLFGLPGFVMPLFATLFNALNVAFCVLAGATLAAIMKIKPFAS